MTGSLPADPLVDAEVRTWLTAVLRDEAGTALPAPAAATPAQVLAVASRQGVASLVHERLRVQADGSELQAAFADAARRQAMQSLWLRAETTRLLEALHAAGLRVLLLKGVALAGWLYPAAHLRDCGDLDLLFASHADAMRAVEVLEACGYPHGYTQGSHAYELVRMPAPGAAFALELDIHWRLLNAPVFAGALDFETLWAGSIAIPALGPPARGLGPVHALLHAAMNRMVNLYTDVGDVLKNLYDVHLLAARFDASDWAQLLEVAAARQLCGVVHAGLQAAHAQLGTVIPPALLASLAQRSTHEPLDPARLGDWAYMQRRNAAALPLPQRLHWLWRRLIPETDFLRKTYGSDASWPRLLLAHWRRFALRVSATRRRTPHP